VFVGQPEAWWRIGMAASEALNDRLVSRDCLLGLLREELPAETAEFLNA
jgi:hypothetical protein